MIRICVYLNVCREQCTVSVSKCQPLNFNFCRPNGCWGAPTLRGSRWRVGDHLLIRGVKMVDKRSHTEGGQQEMAGRSTELTSGWLISRAQIWFVDRWGSEVKRCRWNISCHNCCLMLLESQVTAPLSCSIVSLHCVVSLFSFYRLL